MEHTGRMSSRTGHDARVYQALCTATSADGRRMLPSRVVRAVSNPDICGTKLAGHPNVNSQERARLNIALIITATITATSTIQRTAASIEPKMSAATRTATAATAMAIPIMSSLNRCQKVKGGDVPGGPMGGREEITICILRFIASIIIWRPQNNALALENVFSSI
jgi:hypothetical protein